MFNLIDNIWFYGGSYRVVIEMFIYGCNGVMLLFKKILGEDKIYVVVVYVYSFLND